LVIVAPDQELRTAGIEVMDNRRDIFVRNGRLPSPYPTGDIEEYPNSQQHSANPSRCPHCSATRAEVADSHSHFFLLLSSSLIPNLKKTITLQRTTKEKGAASAFANTTASVNAVSLLFVQPTPERRAY
jgi:hypothetical protein